MRWIYLSPHLDDAILSCGGLLAQQSKEGITVEIWNLMGGIPPIDAPLSDLASSVQADWGTDTAKETLIMRLSEDRLAAERIGAIPRYFDFLDCIYRHDIDGAPLYTEDIFAADKIVPLHTADDGLITQITSLLQKKLLDDDILICPLGIGNHPDHLVVRQAAERINRPLRYYADIPYALLEYSEQLAEMTDKFSAGQYPISEDDLSLWQEAISAYASQLPVLFGGEEMMKDAIKHYRQANRGIQLWGMG